MYFINIIGYGFDDLGCDVFDNVYVYIFKIEVGFVRFYFVSGIYVIGVVIVGNVRFGDKIFCVLGFLYDILFGVLGLLKKKNLGLLDEYGIKIDVVDLDLEGKF